MGCGDPISNQLLYEDALFLAALPSVERLGPPTEVRFARVGTSGLLASAVEQAANVEGVAALLGASGEALRSTPPDERSDVIRSWRSVASAVRISGTESSTWFTRGEVVEPVDGGPLDWSIEVSLDGKDPWIPVGQGTHDPAGTGSFTWEIADHVALLSIPDEVPQALDFEYADPTDDGEPRALIIDDGDVELGNTWQISGDNLLIWLGTLSLVQGEDPVPGAAQVFHLEGQGGLGSGSLITAEGEIPFEICWDANGNDVWTSGGGLLESGNPANCPVTY